ncbi:DUF3618 domain-containing protein [Streptomyces sp. TRM S81-3]|uniref:DUF3618 domain-containing protein n=1 Tax=Streptomyces griseicoloratus TaxID=2752516 RepID=A0A926QQI2_9ACTN|nr:DUF3618 domain-containing protein [Streptomyces griseicoloratus]MBD0420864.1 DUF3618 domain-containing protein [Streptomyces griseicoloratus]
MTDATSGKDASSHSAGRSAGGAKGPDELRRQIEQTRGELGDTVEELAGKADVKGRARARAADLKDKAGAMTGQLRGSVGRAGHTGRGREGRTDHPEEPGAQGRVRGAARAGLRHPAPALVAGAAMGAVAAAGVLRRGSDGHRTRRR